jgi:UDP-2,3-diacylglucosamine hydrolase
VGYQVFRTWTRKHWVQKLFLALPIAWRRAIANHLRANSHAQYQRNAKISYRQNQIKANVTLEACAASLRSHACDKLIHGHTHLPAHHQESLGEQIWQRWVLSD